MKKSLIFKFVFLLFIVVISIVVVLPKGPDLNLKIIGINYKKELKLHKGLDLQGGTQLVYELDVSKEKNKSEAQDKAITVIRNRIDAFGVAEPVIYPESFGNSLRIIIQLPGIQNIDEALNLIGKTAQLEFKEQEPMNVEGGQLMTLQGNWKKEPVLTGAEFKKAEVNRDEQGNVEIDIEFNSEGAKKFAEATKRNIGKQIAIFLDNQVISAPTVQSEIANGKGVITGKFDLKEAKNLAIQLNAGALPVPMKLVEQKNIGATLGEESINNSFLAAVVGLFAVMIFLLAFYRFFGFITVISLFVYTLIVLTIFKLFSVTLTLAGIAGFILSTGAAAEASVLILERIREELRKGKPIETAIDMGYKGAWNSIFDSNMASLILAFIVYYLGTGLIKGFGITLAIGVVISLLTVVLVSGPVLKFLATRSFIRNKKYLSILLGIKEKDIKGEKL